MSGCKRGGVSKVSLTVHPDNTPALALYQGLGFEQERSEPHYFGEEKPRVVLRRILSIDFSDGQR